MDKGTLVEADLESGRMLLNELDGASMDIQAAFWYHDDEADRWRLYLATPLVEKLGSREVYVRIYPLAKKVNPASFDLSDVSVISPGDSRVTVLSLAQLPLTSERGFFFRKGVINGIYFDGIYVYRVPKPIELPNETLAR